MDDWEVRIKSQIKGELDVNPTGQALADLIQEEQIFLAKEVRWLQDKAWKARRRAGERKEHRRSFPRKNAELKEKFGMKLFR